MSTSTLKEHKGLIAPVPVDRVEIVHGPSVSQCMQALEQQNGGAPVALLFTLMTVASTRAFERRLRGVRIFNVCRNGQFTFTATYSNSVVSGRYNPKTRKGWFNED